jgi:hypothetical protein
MDLHKIELRAVITFLTKEGNTPSQIHTRLVNVYNNDSPTLYQVKYWSKQFKWGRESLEDDPRSGRPTESTSQEMCKRVEDLILQDRRIKVAVISKELNISVGSVLEVIHSNLLMSKVSS